MALVCVDFDKAFVSVGIDWKETETKLITKLLIETSYNDKRWQNLDFYHLKEKTFRTNEHLEIIVENFVDYNGFLALIFVFHSEKMDSFLKKISYTSDTQNKYIKSARRGNDNNTISKNSYKMNIKYVKVTPCS